MRDIERWVERGLEAIEGLTHVAKRVAFAVETVVIAGTDENEINKTPCSTCGCRLVLVTDTKCNACGTAVPKLPKEIDYHG